jgi:hydroxyacylglutathione hydrolase
MKRKLFIAVAVIVVLIAVLLAPFAAAFLGNTPIVDGTQLGRDARLVADGYALLYVVPHGDKKVALVDCGIDPEAKAVVRELNRRGLTADAVTHIFITHGHPDHTAGCARFPQAEIVAMAAEIPLLDGAPLHNSPVGRLAGSKPT